MSGARYRHAMDLGDSIADLEAAAADPNCRNREQCAAEAAVRRGLEERARREIERRAIARTELADNPFDARREVSADARYIAGRVVKHMWIILVGLPVVVGILFLLLHAAAAVN